MLSSESGLVDTTLLLLLSEHDCVMLLLWQAVQSALHLQNTQITKPRTFAHCEIIL